MRRDLIAATVFLIGASAPALAADQPKDLVEYRQAVMSSLGGHAGAIARIVKRQVGYDHIVPHARAIAATAPVVGDVWPDNSKPSDYEKTDALPEIWQQPEDFRKKIDTFEEAANNFLATAQDGDDAEIVAAFKELGQACGGCHDDYRAED